MSDSESFSGSDDSHSTGNGVRVASPRIKADISTILGLSIALGLIVVAIMMGHGNANFINAPALLIVVLGTMAATSVSYTSSEIAQVPGIIGNTLLRRIRKPSEMAMQLMEMAQLTRKSGILALTRLQDEINKDPFLSEAVQLVSDGFTAEDIDRVLRQEMDALVERHRRSASIVRRAAETAPAMGLIGTLVGLVQMLAQLDDPASIGPAMAVALLTTFYGAILGTVILGPLAAKLERNSNDEAMIKGLIHTAMCSMARQENPRRLEMQMNSVLPPAERIEYFK